MKIIFIRHGKTYGNRHKRYIGKTNEPLCEEGISEIRARRYPEADIVVSSPLVRCIQTAEIIYPKEKILVYDDLRECDFGDFEGKNYVELSGDPYYQLWIDSGGTMPFPNGESRTSFRSRCLKAFDAAVYENVLQESAAFVVHGGTIMAILDNYAEPKGSFYDFQISNGCGFVTEWNGAKLHIIERI